MNHLGPTIQWSTGCNWPFLGFILWTKSFVIIMTKVSKKICESPLCFVMHCDCTASLRHTAVHSSRQKWTEKGRCPCVANKWQFAFRAAIFTALMGFYTGPFLLDYPHPISLINASAEFSNQIILNCVRICEDEHWGGAKRACLGFWLMRVTFSSTCHLQLMLLNHHPPLVERWGRNKKWHSAFFFLPLPPAGRHKTIWRQNSAIRFKPLREMRCNW